MQEIKDKIVTTDQYFGGCPKCGAGGCLNVRKSHYGACGDHQVFWPIGYNLFSSWQEESPDIWRENESLLATFTEVQPIYPPDRMRPAEEPIPPGDCVLCSKGDVHKGGGILWTDDKWICSPCWREVAKSHESTNSRGATEDGAEVGQLRAELEGYFEQLWGFGTYNAVMWLIDHVVGITDESKGCRDVKVLTAMSIVAREHMAHLNREGGFNFKVGPKGDEVEAIVHVLRWEAPGTRDGCEDCDEDVITHRGRWQLFLGGGLICHVCAEKRAPDVVKEWLALNVADEVEPSDTAYVN